MILVSIIIPAYNATQTIDATIISALQQQGDWFTTEIIIVDDGSTDETTNILKNYQQNCTIITQSNFGTSAARQNGFEVCKGDYIQYLDADDLLSAGKIALQLKALLINDADIAYGDFEKFSKQNNQFIIAGLVEGAVKGEADVAIFKSFWRPPAALLYSRRIAEKIFWSTTLPVIQDARYLLDAVFRGGKLVYTPGIMAGYRINQLHSLSQYDQKAFIKDCFVNATEVYIIWKNDLKNQPEKRDALIEVLRNCITEFSITNQQLFNQAIDLLLKISPKYIPQKSFSLKVLSWMFGYRNAEKLASLKRKLS
ncbi:MAG: glycosyltransferase family 2 protein [Janthinobacterium lividum]